MANLRISELDFDTIKTNLKTYLQAQSEFTDYDFEGSGLSVLLDILAYNTHYNAYLANMLANEMFLDSAIKRSSVVSLAKHLGYTPRSTRGSTATLDVTVNNPTGSPSTLTLDRYSSFTSSINGTSYNFLTTDPVTIQPVGGVYTFNDLRVKQGALLEFNYPVVAPGPDEKYVIPNSDVDTTTMLVTVQTSSIDTTTVTYTLCTDITGVDGEDSVYFLEENPLGNYQIYFGDDVIGKKLTAGNIVRIQYLVCVGTDSNVSGNISQSFFPSAPIGGSSDISVTTVSNSSGGAAKESISSIRFNAPRSNQARNRAVTKNDYSVLIKSQYPTVESVAVWGGEENNPPAYGKVFISLKPFAGFTLDSTVKDTIKNTILKDRKTLTVSPEFVDPDYLFVNLVVNARYNKNQTIKSASQIGELIRAEITDYFSNNLQQFELPFYYSQLSNLLSSVDPSIVSVLIELKIQKRLNPVLNVSNSYIEDDSLQFSNKIHPGELESSRFFTLVNGTSTQVKLRDIPSSMPPDYNGTGVIGLFRVDNNVKVTDIGTVNYATGVVTISGLTPLGYPANQYDISITAQVQEDSYDIIAAKNQIIVLDDSTRNDAAGKQSGITINVTTI